MIRAIETNFINFSEKPTSPNPLPNQLGDVGKEAQFAKGCPKSGR
jgi:hypothetical protein